MFLSHYHFESFRNVIIIPFEYSSCFMHRWSYRIHFHVSCSSTGCLRWLCLSWLLLLTVRLFHMSGHDCLSALFRFPSQSGWLLFVSYNGIYLLFRDESGGEKSVIMHKSPSSVTSSWNYCQLEDSLSSNGYRPFPFLSGLC